MRKFLLLSALLLFTLFSIAQKSKTAVDNRLAGLDAELEKILKDWKISGFAVAIVEKNKIIYSKGFGYRDYENKKAVRLLRGIGRLFCFHISQFLKRITQIYFMRRPSK